jgi:hypothetical protein
VRRLLTWIVVTLGIAALVRRLRQRAEPDELAPATEGAGDPADELRRKLEESRAEENAAPGSAPAPEPEPTAKVEATVEERRASVHEQGRSTLDEMRGPDED